MAEVDVDLEASLGDMMDIQDMLRELDDTMGQLEDNMNAIKAEIEAGQSDLQPSEKLAEKIQEARLQQAENVNDYLTATENFQRALAEKIGNGVTPADLDLSGPPSEWNENVRNWFYDLGDDVGNGINKLQDSVGESGKPLEESPRTLDKLKEFLKDNYKLISMYAILAGISIGANWKDNFEQKNQGLSGYQSVGCFQYDINSGTIRPIGICQANKICSDRNQGNCESGGPVDQFCRWNANSGKCEPGERLTNGKSCGFPCKQNSDCHTVDPVPCDPVTKPCLYGECQDGKCQGGQICNQTTKTCSPAVSFDPKYPLTDQMKAGKLGFCLSGLPPTPCPGASSICSGVSENGCCPECEDGDGTCNSSGGIVKSNCLCKGDNWTTIPMCGGISDILSTLVYMQTNLSAWVPAKTPIIIWILVGIGVLMFLITLIWYVRYLIKHGKK